MQYLLVVATNYIPSVIPQTVIENGNMNKFNLFNLMKEPSPYVSFLETSSWGPRTYPYLLEEPQLQDCVHNA